MGKDSLFSAYLPVCPIENWLALASGSRGWNLVLGDLNHFIKKVTMHKIFFTFCKSLTNLIAKPM